MTSKEVNDGPRIAASKTFSVPRAQLSVSLSYRGYGKTQKESIGDISCRKLDD